MARPENCTPTAPQSLGIFAPFDSNAYLAGTFVVGLGIFELPTSDPQAVVRRTRDDRRCLVRFVPPNPMSDGVSQNSKRTRLRLAAVVGTGAHRAWRSWTSRRGTATYPANRTQGWRAVGGHLLLTNQRLCFCPHGFDRATGSKSWECELTTMSSVSMAACGRQPFNGPSRPRLEVDCAGVSEFFVVKNVPAVAAAVAGGERHLTKPGEIVELIVKHGPVATKRRTASSSSWPEGVPKCRPGAGRRPWTVGRRALYRTVQYRTPPVPHGGPKILRCPR